MIINKSLIVSSRIQQKKGNIVSDMNGEVVMLSINNGKYYNFGEVGGEIWNLIHNWISIDSLVSKLMEVYDIEEDECIEQVLSFLEELSKEELIDIEV
jgi:hypothetical protein